MDKLTETELKSLLKSTKKKRKVNTSKRGFILLTIWAMAIQTYVMIMIVKLQDTTSLAIITGVVFGEIIAFYLGYLKYSRDINLAHMDKNYIENYDEER